jgi:hypothetical protein
MDIRDQLFFFPGEGEFLTAEANFDRFQRIGKQRAQKALANHRGVDQPAAFR